MKFTSLNCVSIPPASHVTIFTLPSNSEMLKVLCIWCNERDWLWSSISLLQLCYSTIKTLKYLNKSFQQRLKWPTILTVLTSRFVGSRSWGHVSEILTMLLRKFALFTFICSCHFRRWIHNNLGSSFIYTW